MENFKYVIKLGNNTGYMITKDDSIELYDSEEKANETLGWLIWLDQEAKAVKLSTKEIADLQEESSNGI